MKDIANQIDETVMQHVQLFSVLSEEVMSAKKKPGQWSAKEVIGHLIDSAQNNIQRFVRSQYEDIPRIVYSQDDWVRLQGYQSRGKDELISLWVALNKHLCRIVSIMDPANTTKQTNTGETAPELHTLAFLANDYLAHMVHHLNQIKDRTKKV